MSNILNKIVLTLAFSDINLLKKSETMRAQNTGSSTHRHTSKCKFKTLKAVSYNPINSGIFAIKRFVILFDGEL